MVILFHLPDPAAPRWLAALRQALPEAEVREAAELAGRPADYAVVFNPDATRMDAIARVKAVFNLGAGVNAFWSLPELPAGIPLIRLEDAGMAEQMAEYALYAVLRRYREFAFYAEEQRAARWTQRPRRPKRDFRVGVLGLGALGTHVAAVLRDADFPVLGWSRTPRSVEGIVTHAGDAGLAALLPQCQALIALLPLTPATTGLLDRKLFAQLPSGAFVVNVGRGALLVEADLLAALDCGHLGGAMLDVFAEEPLPDGHPFWHHPRIEITPHVSALTQVDASVAQVAAKIRSLERGETVSGVVDRARRY